MAAALIGVRQSTGVFIEIGMNTPATATFHGLDVINAFKRTGRVLSHIAQYAKE